MRSVLLCLLAVLLAGEAQAQYQKMSKSSSINVSGFQDYINIGWSKNLSNRNSLNLNGFYFKDDDSIISRNNWGANLKFSRWFIRVSDFYVSGGFGTFFSRTNAKAINGIDDSDNSLGLDFGGQLEYFPRWWLVLYAELNQMVYFGSEYYRSKVVGGGGIKLVF